MARLTPTALATDYDGTIAREGVVAPATVRALLELKSSGVRLVLVTGRELEDLRQVFDRLELFDRVVAENGALLYRPASGEMRLLGPPPPRDLITRLEAEGAAPLSVGHVIVATREPYEAVARRAIADFALPWRVILNKGAVMCLPEGVDKASGLRIALAELGLDPADALAVGDAENDLAMLEACGFPAAVANAGAELKRVSRFVAEGDDGDGVRQLIRRWLNDPAGMFSPAGRRAPGA
jgi:hydroxymethylpyrimidine pyrophosphatase-like HAD family hydrolase